MSIEIEVTPLTEDTVRVKFHGLPDDKGPDLIMDYPMVRETVAKLQACLPESIIAEEIPKEI